MHCRYPVFLCFLLMAMAYFEGSFLKPLVSVGTGMPGYASAGEMKEIPEYAGESGREAAGKTMPEQALIKDFGIVRQMPELPTGCEITALTMMLDYYGCQADKTIMAEKYLPTVPAEFYEGEEEGALEQLLALLEPAMILLMGLIVGTVVLSVLIPLYSLYSQML